MSSSEYKKNATVERSCRTCDNRPLHNKVNQQPPCRIPVEAGLSNRFEICYHPDGGETCNLWEPRINPYLEIRIRKMAKRWNYTQENLEKTIEMARYNPEEWNDIVSADEKGEFYFASGKHNKP